MFKVKWWKIKYMSSVIIKKKKRLVGEWKRRRHRSSSWSGTLVSGKHQIKENCERERAMPIFQEDVMILYMYVPSTSTLECIKQELVKRKRRQEIHNWSGGVNLLCQVLTEQLDRKSKRTWKKWTAQLGNGIQLTLSLIRAQCPLFWSTHDIPQGSPHSGP